MLILPAYILGAKSGAFSAKFFNSVCNFNLAFLSLTIILAFSTIWSNNPTL